MPYTNYLPEEVESRGEKIYEQQIRHKVEPEDKGKFIVIDIETGEYEIVAELQNGVKQTIHKFDPNRESWRQFQFSGSTLEDARRLIESQSDAV